MEDVERIRKIRQAKELLRQVSDSYPDLTGPVVSPLEEANKAILKALARLYVNDAVTARNTKLMMF